MIFIWSSNGGPLQYVGLALFALQFFPHLLPSLSALLGSVPAPALVGTASALLLPALWLSRRRIAGAASDGVRGVWASVRDATGIDSDAGIALLLSGVVMLVSALAVLADAFVLGAALQIVAFLAVLRAQAGEGVDDGGAFRGRGEEDRMSEILRTVQKMPVEEFVPEEDVGLAERVSVSKLKRMLKVRGRPVREGTCLERSDLVDAVRECRNYCDTCCICCEEYAEGDPLRILPKCRHEFHLECLDQWAYTFANRAKRGRDPSCPLCNVALK